MHLTIRQCPSAGKMLSLVVELGLLADLVVEMLPEVEQLLEVRVQPLVKTQAPVFLPDQRTGPSSLCAPCPNFPDPRTYTALAHPRVLVLFEKVLSHFLS